MKLGGILRLLFDFWFAIGSKLFNILVDLLEWISQQQGVSFLSPLYEWFHDHWPPRILHVSTKFDTITQVCKWLGIPLALEKVEGPSTSLNFLGCKCISQQTNHRELENYWASGCLRKGHQTWDYLTHRSATACHEDHPTWQNIP